MKNREQRIADARFKLMGVKLSNESLITQLTKQINDAELELKREEASFDPGEHVKVTEHCNRGCCVEWEFEGTVIGRDPNGNGDYRIMTDKGEQRAYPGDMKRTNETKPAERQAQETQVQGKTGQAIVDDRLDF